MSYVLHIWEQPVPTSVAEADGIQARLSGERCPQNPKFEELARRLTKRHPCVTELDDDDPQAVWSDGPLDGRTDRAVYSVGVQTGRLATVVPFVSEVAGELGLVVYDMQAGEVHLPDNRVLTLPGRSPVDFGNQEEVGPEDLDTRRHVAEILQQCLKPTLEPLGFKALRSNASFKRCYKACEQILYFNITEGYPYFTIEFFFRVNPRFNGRCQAVADHNAAGGWAIDTKAAAELAGVKPFGHRPELYGRTDIFNVSGLKAWASELAIFLSTAVIPIAQKCGAAKDVELLINPIPPARPVFKRRMDSLILAFAVQNPRLDQLIEEWRHEVQPGYMAEILEKLMADLQAC